MYYPFSITNEKKAGERMLVGLLCDQIHAHLLRIFRNGMCAFLFTSHQQQRVMDLYNEVESLHSITCNRVRKYLFKLILRIASLNNGYHHLP